MQFCRFDSTQLKAAETATKVGKPGSVIRLEMASASVGILVKMAMQRYLVSNLTNEKGNFVCPDSSQTTSWYYCCPYFAGWLSGEGKSKKISRAARGK